MLRINNFPALVHIMAWCRPCIKPLSEPMMVSLLTHICVDRLQWVNRETHETASMACRVGTAVEIVSLSNLARLGVLTFITKMSVSNSDHTTEGSLPLHDAKSSPVFQWPIQFKQRICMYIGMSLVTQCDQTQKISRMWNMFIVHRDWGIYVKQWGVITHPCHDFNQVRAWIIIYISHRELWNSFPVPYSQLIHVSKRSPRDCNTP